MVSLTSPWIQLLPLAVNASISFVFLSTLRRDKTPLITAIATIEAGGTLPTELAMYTRRLTMIWGIFPILLGIKHLFITWPQGWELAALLVDSIAVSLFFLLEFAWRQRRFLGHTFVSPWTLLQLIRQHGGLFHIYRRCMEYPPL